MDEGYCGHVAEKIASKTLNRLIEILKLISLDIVNYLSIANYTYYQFYHLKLDRERQQGVVQLVGNSACQIDT